MNTKGVPLKVVSYLTAVIVLSILFLLSYFSYATFFDIILLIIGLGLGAFASYILFHSFTQERTIKFFPGEQLILKSSGPGSYVVMKHVDEKAYPPEPLKSDLYLTNMGIIAEAPDTGRSILFIPHDKVLDYAPYETGILIHYLGLNNQFSEARIYIEDRSAWINAIYALYARAGGDRQI